MPNLKERIEQLLASKKRQENTALEENKQNTKSRDEQREEQLKKVREEAERMRKLLEKTRIAEYFESVSRALEANGIHPEWGDIYGWGNRQEGNQPHWNTRDGMGYPTDDYGFYFYSGKLNPFKQIILHWGSNGIKAMVFRNEEISISGEKTFKFSREEWQQNPSVIEEAVFKAFQNPSIYQGSVDTRDYFSGQTPPY